MDAGAARDKISPPPKPSKFSAYQNPSFSYVITSNLPAKLPVPNLQQGPQAQQNILVPIMQDCLNAITEHQKLRALVKGEWVKGLLPQSTVRADYTVQRIREHPKWMLHVNATSYAGAQSSKNPLFLGVLPPKERFPEKYIATVSTVPSVLHPGSCMLVVGRQSPPIFTL